MVKTLESELHSIRNIRDERARFTIKSNEPGNFQVECADGKPAQPQQKNGERNGIFDCGSMPPLCQPDEKWQQRQYDAQFTARHWPETSAASSDRLAINANAVKLGCLKIDWIFIFYNF